MAPKLTPPPRTLIRLPATRTTPCPRGEWPTGHFTTARPYRRTPAPPSKRDRTQPPVSAPARHQAPPRRLPGHGIQRDGPCQWPPAEYPGSIWPKAHPIPAGAHAMDLRRWSSRPQAEVQAKSLHDISRPFKKTRRKSSSVFPVIKTPKLTCRAERRISRVVEVYCQSADPRHRQRCAARACMIMHDR